MAELVRHVIALITVITNLTVFTEVKFNGKESIDEYEIFGMSSRLTVNAFTHAWTQYWKN